MQKIIKGKSMNKLKKALCFVLPMLCAFIVCFSVCFKLDVFKAKGQDEPVRSMATGEDTGASSASRDVKGGAIYLESGCTMELRNGTITGHSQVYGGAIYVCSGATFTLDGGTIKGNSATYGGAIYVENGGTCNILSGNIIANEATSESAIFYEDGANVTISPNAKVFGGVRDKGLTPIDLISSDTKRAGTASDSFHYIKYGYYPEDYVGDGMNGTLESWFEANSPKSVRTYSINGNVWQTYMYTDGELYARGASIRDGSGEYRNGNGIKSNGSITWFKVQRLTWFILNYNDVVNGSATQMYLMSEAIVASNVVYYPNTSDSGRNTWEKSHVRTFLNNEFYNQAFPEIDRNKILTTNVSVSSGNPTNDKVYIPSLQDTNDHFSNQNNRCCSPTDFALSNNCNMTDGITVGTSNYRGRKGNAHYWTRSADSAASEVRTVSDLGYNTTMNHWTVTKTNIGIRPMLTLAVR